MDFFTYIIPRKVKNIYQKITRGFTDRDIYDLDVTIAEFISPRIKEFTKKQKERFEENGSLSSFSNNDIEDEKYLADLEKIDRAFDLLVQEANDFEVFIDIINEKPKKKEKEINKGLKLFAKHFRTLWD